MDTHVIISLLKEEIRPALGVTEPSAVALACAAAYRYLGGDIEHIALVMDPGVFKNAYSCAVPGTGETGIEMAALLGVLCGDPELGLEVLRPVGSAHVTRARELKEKGIVDIDVTGESPGIYIEATVTAGTDEARVVIQGRHDAVVEIEVNGETVLRNRGENGEAPQPYDIHTLSLGEMISFADTVPLSDLGCISEAIAMNTALAEAGRGGAGMGLGRGMERLEASGTLGDDIVTHAQRLTACAVDARMGGMPHPAMSVCGSGDHGIIAVLPLVAAAGRKGVSEERLVRATALSCLVTIYIKKASGRLSAFCGCAVAAGTGAAAGVAWLLGGTAEQVKGAILNMAADITGIICDGGNFGCSLKAATGAGTAVLSALLSLEGVTVPAGSGIVGNTAGETMRNMGRIASPGMTGTNDTILEIMRRQ